MYACVCVCVIEIVCVCVCVCKNIVQVHESFVHGPIRKDALTHRESECW